MIKTITLENNQALTLPLYLSGDECVIKIECGSFFTELKTSFSTKATDKKIVLPLPLFGNVTISGDERLVKDISTTVYQETESALTYHFAPQFGWINDPNGMIYHEGFYHLFFQYNPVGREWGNMSWGHAYSKDLIFWQQSKTALFPEDVEHTIFSGSAIKIADTIYFPYTEANITPPQNFKQCLAVSKDMKNLEKKGAFLTTGGEVRDPRVFRYNGELYFLTFDKGNDFSLYLVQDEFKTVKKLSTVTLPPLWECPDLYQLKDEEGCTHLFFTGADGIVHRANIDGDKFTVEQEGTPLFLTKLPYAGQTFSETEETILISWLRTKNEGKLYHGVMSMPRRLTLKDGQIRLEEVSSFIWNNTDSEKTTSLTNKTGKAYKLELNCADITNINIGGTNYIYNPKTNIFSSKDESVNFKGKDGCIILYVDDEIIEVQDTTLSTVAYFECENSGTLNIESGTPFEAKIYHLGGLYGNT